MARRTLSPAYCWLVGSLSGMLLLLLVLPFPPSLPWSEAPAPLPPSAKVYPQSSLLLDPPAPEAVNPQARGPLVPSSGGILIIIDDMGENIEAAHTLLRLPFSVTFSIWPTSRLAPTVARLAYEAGRDVLIHMPMQPKAFPRITPGQGALMLHTQEQEMRLTFEEAQRRVPHALGINNHMGSAFTCNAQAVELFCRIVAPSGLIVLDSVTHPASLLYATAGQAGLPRLRRDIFLDNILNEKSILEKLHEAQKLTHSKGLVVVIGHPHPQTLAVLQKWKPQSTPILTIRQLFPDHKKP